MRLTHNAHLTNFDVTSLRVTPTHPTQQVDVKMVRDEAIREAMIARDHFLSREKPTQSRAYLAMPDALI